jgi:uncharacterized protein YkwD
MNRVTCSSLNVLIVAACLVLAVTLRAEPTRPDLDKTRVELLKRHNKERMDADLKPLKLSAELTAAAQSYAEYLAESGEFGHKAKGTPRSRVKDAGYDARAVGENIANGQTSASEVVDGWMESEVHRDNILSEDFSEVGFGIAKDKKGRILWIADFGDR